jgi:hypothetical protein
VWYSTHFEPEGVSRIVFLNSCQYSNPCIVNNACLGGTVYDVSFLHIAVLNYVSDQYERPCDRYHWFLFLFKYTVLSVLKVQR